MAYKRPKKSPNLVLASPSSFALEIFHLRSWNWPVTQGCVERFQSRKSAKYRMRLRHFSAVRLSSIRSKYEERDPLGRYRMALVQAQRSITKRTVPFNSCAFFMRLFFSMGAEACAERYWCSRRTIPRWSKRYLPGCDRASYRHWMWTPGG